MCFSASVSYGSAALLIATGTVATIGNKSKPQRMIAAIPFLFGLQQVAEGIVWQTMGHDSASSLHQFGVWLFLTFANVIWPGWLPWSLYKIEVHEKRRRILRVLAWLGSGTSLLAALVIYRADVSVYVRGHSLIYDISNLNRFWPVNLEPFLYLLATMVPFFVSSLRTVKIAGYLVFGSMLLAQVINREATTSVWCFFAAVISFFIALNVIWLGRGRVA